MGTYLVGRLVMFIWVTKVWGCTQNPTCLKIKPKIHSVLNRKPRASGVVVIPKSVSLYKVPLCIVTYPSFPQLCLTVFSMSPSWTLNRQKKSAKLIPSINTQTDFHVLFVALCTCSFRLKPDKRVRSKFCFYFQILKCFPKLSTLLEIA